MAPLTPYSDHMVRHVEQAQGGVIDGRIHEVRLGQHTLCLYRSVIDPIDRVEQTNRVIE